MVEWVAVTSTAAFGSLAGAVRSEGIRTAGNWATVSSYRKWLGNIIPPAIVDAIGGAILSFILWGTYTSDFDFTSSRFPPAEAVASLLVGLGGASGLGEYLRLEKKFANAERVNNDLLAAATEMDEAAADPLDGKTPPKA
jgi:hypothetical protein